MVGSIMSAVWGRTEGPVGWATERATERQRVEERLTDAEGSRWEQRLWQVGSGSMSNKGMVARDG
jgi:hypothetical protein